MAEAKKLVKQPLVQDKMLTPWLVSTEQHVIMLLEM
jgi:hypothetical protein